MSFGMVVAFGSISLTSNGGFSCSDQDPGWFTLLLHRHHRTSTITGSELGTTLICSGVMTRAMAREMSLSRRRSRSGLRNGIASF